MTDHLVERLSEQLLRYRELLALSYEQKDALEKGGLDRFVALLDARQTIIDNIKAMESEADELRRSPDSDHDVTRRLTEEAALLLEKIISLDKENERLLEVRLNAAGDELRSLRVARAGRSAYQRGAANGTVVPKFVDQTK